MDQYYKDLLTKAAWSALYAGIAELSVVQTFDQKTVIAALVGAGLRAVIVFVSTIKDQVAPEPASSKAKIAKSAVKASWTANL